MYAAAAKMKSLGAKLIQIPDSFGKAQLYGMGEYTVMTFEFKQALKAYLSELKNTKIKNIEGKYCNILLSTYV
jgi:hypothetical protein